MRRKSSGWFARWILGCKGAILVCVGGHVVRGGAQEFEIDVCRLRDTSHIFPNVINLDFRFRTRILSPSNSSGLRFSGGVLDFGVQDIEIQRRKPLQMGARINASPPCFDPEVSWKNLLMGVFEMTHTSK